MDCRISCPKCDKQSVHSSLHSTYFSSPPSPILYCRQEIAHCPPILTISLVYSDPSLPPPAITSLLYSLCSPSSNDSYILQAFVIYRGCHYFSVCSECDHEREQFVWVLYNDGDRVVFDSPNHMLAQCMQLNGVPVLLMFSKVLFPPAFLIPRRGLIPWKRIRSDLLSPKVPDPIPSPRVTSFAPSSPFSQIQTWR